jgi:hypothetical protein
MRYVAVVLVLLSAVLSLQGIAYSQPPSKDNQRPVGYKTTDCENKCTKDQQCMLHNEDEKYYCWTLKPTNGAVQKQMEVYISCNSIGGVQRTKCASKDFPISSLMGRNEVPVRTRAPGQCCLPKSKLKVY